MSKDKGKTWSPFFTGQNSLDSLITEKNTLTHASSKGILTSNACGISWQWMNDRFEPIESSQNSQDQKGSLIFPKIKISPIIDEIYALHSGNRFWRSNNLGNPYIRYTGIYKLDKEMKQWIQLGHPDKTSPSRVLDPYWKYPIDFAVDWQNPQRIYLIDFSTVRAWKAGGVWFSADEGKSWEQKLQFDSPRKILINGNTVYMAGWSDNPDDPFIFKPTTNGEFEPLNVHIPLQKVDDYLWKIDI